MNVDESAQATAGGGTDLSGSVLTHHEAALVALHQAGRAAEDARRVLDVLRSRYRAAVEAADGAAMWRNRTALDEGREHLAAAEVARARARADVTRAAVDEATDALAVHRQEGDAARQRLAALAREAAVPPEAGAHSITTTMAPERLQRRSVAQGALQHASGREMIAGLQQTDAGRRRVVAETELRAMIDATCQGVA